VSGAVFRSTSRQHRHWPSSADASRLISSGAASHDFRSLVVTEKSHVITDTLIIFVTYLFTVIIIIIIIILPYYYYYYYYLSFFNETKSAEGCIWLAFEYVWMYEVRNLWT